MHLVVDNVGRWLSIFLLYYRHTLGFVTFEVLFPPQTCMVDVPHGP